MDLDQIRSRMANCPCGLPHEIRLEALEIRHGLLHETAALLRKFRFPNRLLLAADEHSFAVTKGLYEQLLSAGFVVELRVYEDTRVAAMETVEELQILLRRVDGCLSVGTGSVNDVCRLAAFREHKDFAIFATAPSMDGFASDSAPIIENGFKVTIPCFQPRIILADSKILAESPTELKAAGFGDVLAKYVAIADWRVANLLHGDYYCERVGQFVRDAVAKMTALADQVPQQDEEAAVAILEALVLTGLSMQFAKTTRPASGTEHIISHFWECRKLQQGLISDFHGKKVAVATLVTAKSYHNLTKLKAVKAHPEAVDWEDVKAHYGPGLAEGMMELNLPHSIADEVDPKAVEEHWPEIVKIIREEIPT
ncbi:MAG: iron-containing alcohol dehydrogenase, partial [Lachnospiraceae bacterium]|nr:iron-containing alcohol dehydrogenase [Lachnospiraceae bacterium]